METAQSTKGSRCRSLDVQPGTEGLGSTSEPFSSDGHPISALAAATTAAAASSADKATVLSAKTPACHSEPNLLMNHSSDSLLGDPCTEASFTHSIGHGKLGIEPIYVSHIAQDPCTTKDLSSSPGPVLGSSSGPCHGSDQDTGPDSGPGPATDSGPGPGCGHDREPSRHNLPSFRTPHADMVPNYASWNHYCHWEPRKQPWKFLQVSEPGARGHWKTPEVEGKCKVPNETLPRGHSLLYNWEEERATNHLDQVPSMQDGSESFFFRHGHQGLLTLQLQSPMSFSTTQKDSYQPPRNCYQPTRGKREAMLEMLLRHQICKEVQAEQEATRKQFEVESVTHHDYRKELVQAGPPAPTKPHDYRREQPETFWIQRAPQLPVCEGVRSRGKQGGGRGCSVLAWRRAGSVLILAFLQGVSSIKTLDTPFRKNCSFSTPVPLSLGQPLPYEPENYSHQLGEISSLVCQGGGQGGGMGGTTI
ncbi:sperm-associated antigen 8 isoform X1 [Neofelis nebulosa]|uniref:sperm-associated antigen 8 isoform X1 n=2 Tax=Neofelis nebulosa TaxID=61452 RepID=UPI00272B24A4|nr:sperm-associated antigen 8 isoform X1 [Neofelis nebulosa]